MRKRTVRRQHVKWRRRHREQVSRRVGGSLLRGSVLAGAMLLAFFFVVHPQSWTRRTLQRHTPTLQVEAPAALAGLPVGRFVSEPRWLLWVPGVATWNERRLQRQFPVVLRARMEHRYAANKIVVRLEPRRPLALWGTQGIDETGTLFPLANDPGSQIPTLDADPSTPKEPLGRWLSELSRVSWLWADLDGVILDPQGHYVLMLRSGPVLAWGPPEIPVKPKTDVLARIFAQARAQRGGVTRADLRFFHEGRIIVAHGKA